MRGGNWPKSLAWLCAALLPTGHAWAEEHVGVVPRAQLMAAVRDSVRAQLSEQEPQMFADLPLYDLDITLDDDLTGYALRETLELTNTTAKPLADLVLRLFSNSGPNQPAPISVAAVSCGEQTCSFTQPRASVLQIKPPAPIAPGARLSVTVQLKGKLRVIASGQTDMMTQGLESFSSMLSGEQTSDYGLLSYGDDIASFAHFYAVVAQRNARGWVTDEQKPFGDIGAGGLSFVRAAIHAPHAVTIASSGLMREQLAPGLSNTRTIKVDAPLVRDFAFSASRAFTQRSRQVGDVTVRAFYLPKDAEGGARVLDTAAHALEIFERRFGPYPYPELSVVEGALVGGAGGCEFSGFVTIASMLYRPLPMDPSVLAMMGDGVAGSPLEFTTAHEVAHQYWYGLVGSDARAHPFVDESLTQWSARLYFEERFGEARGKREADAQIAMNYRMMRMLGHADAAVDRPVDAYDSSLTYGGLVYGKGAYLYPALRTLLGDAAYFDALRGYARQYRFREAPPTALFERMAATSGGHAAKVKALVQHWLHERHGDRDLGTPRTHDNHDSHDAHGTGSAGHAQSNGSFDIQQLSGMLQGMMGGGGPVDAQQLQGMVQGMLGSSGGRAADVKQLQGLLKDMLGGDGDAVRSLSTMLDGLGGSTTPRADDTHAPTQGRGELKEMPSELRELTGEDTSQRGL